MTRVPSGNVLFVTICSRQKEPGGSAHYDTRVGVAQHLEGLSTKFIDNRRKLFEYLKFDQTFRWQGLPLNEHEYNSDLTLGPDLGGNETAQYRPAVERYDGRFYKTLGARGRSAILKSPHHTLILSGLYGIVRPSEPLQMYSCPVGPHVSSTWTNNSLVTKALAEYCRTHQIVRVFDATAVQSYRDIVDWSRLAADTGSEIIRCFSLRADGEDSLIDLAELFADYLLTAPREALLTLEPGAKKRGFLFERPDFDASALPKKDSEPSEGTELVPASEGPWRFNPTAQYLRDLSKHKTMYTAVSRAEEEILNGPVTPRGDTKKPLAGEKHGQWRYRLGNFRLFYTPNPVDRIISLDRIDARGDAYKD